MPSKPDVTAAVVALCFAIAKLVLAILLLIMAAKTAPTWVIQLFIALVLFLPTSKSSS